MPYFFSRLHAHRRSPRAPQKLRAASLKSISHANVHASGSDEWRFTAPIQIGRIANRPSRKTLQAPGLTACSMLQPPNWRIIRATAHWGAAILLGEIQEEICHEENGPCS